MFCTAFWPSDSPREYAKTVLSLDQKEIIIPPSSVAIWAHKDSGGGREVDFFPRPHTALECYGPSPSRGTLTPVPPRPLGAPGAGVSCHLAEGGGGRVAPEA